MEDNKYITVSGLNKYIKNILESESYLSNLKMVGEISNFTNHFKTGHFYFTLKDKNSSIKAVMFNSYASSISFKPEDGMNVVIKGNVSVYQPNGIYQIYCKDMVPFGQGSYKLAFEKLKASLSNKGYFDSSRKLSIPKNANLAVITSLDGAAIKDVLSVIQRRNPLIKVTVYPAIMQGENCAKSVIEALDIAEENQGIDAILITRGGGSIEDLWRFNDEVLANRVYSRKKPIVSAIGHEIDYTILDFVSDVRAATPSVAAELLVDDIFSIDFNAIKENIKASVHNKIKYEFANLEHLKKSTDIQIFKNYILNFNSYFRDSKTRIDKVIKNILNEKSNELMHITKVFDTVNFSSILKRGYSLTKIDENIIKSIEDVNINDIITTVVKDGRIISKIISKDIGEN